MSMTRFLWAYIKSMRLYYAFVTGIAGWIGVAYYSHLEPEQTSPFRSLLVLTLLFMTWGINQVVNDYLGLAEDRINAPHRPMVSGELNPRLALGLSLSLMGFVALLSWFLNPWTLVPIALGVALNILYETAKGWSLWGNIVFGLSIAMCTVYGFLASGPLPSPVFTGNRICVFILVVRNQRADDLLHIFHGCRGGCRCREKNFHRETRFARCTLCRASWRFHSGASLYHISRVRMASNQRGPSDA